MSTEQEQQQIANQNDNNNTEVNLYDFKTQKGMNTLQGLLDTPPELRSEEINKKISKFVKNIKFLQKYCEKPEFLDLCRYLYVKTYEKKQCIFRQGDMGDTFYIILHGSVIIYVDEPTEYKNFMQLREVARLKQGDSFGEIALLYNSQRTATITAAEKTNLIVLEKDVFQTYIKEMNNSHLNYLIHFLESLNIFTLLQKNIIVELTTKCNIKRYPSNTIILRQNADVAALYIVKAGRLKAVRLIPFRINPLTKEKIINDCNDPSPEEVKNNQFTTEFIELTELSNNILANIISFINASSSFLGDGDIFGDYQMLNQVEMDYSIITQIPTELVYVTIYEINKIVPKENLEVYKKSLKPFPNNFELRQIYWEKKNWQSFKDKLFQNIAYDKQNKQSFEHQLRGPLQRYIQIKPPINKVDIKSSDNNLYFQVLENQLSKSVQIKRQVTNFGSFFKNINLPDSIGVNELKEEMKDIESFSKREKNRFSLHDRNRSMPDFSAQTMTPMVQNSKIKLPKLQLDSPKYSKGPLTTNRTSKMSTNKHSLISTKYSKP